PDDLLFRKAAALHALVLVVGQNELQTGLNPRGKVRVNRVSLALTRKLPVCPYQTQCVNGADGPQGDILRAAASISKRTRSVRTSASGAFATGSSQ
ncbi:hypothetical protein, partial [Bradyrhizobium sp. MOS001]|uniref:hypothetical protein n=1 Tax=Bradyrhizobium sp. MOS001 TaxID=2133948 RepID=UPI0019613A91